MKIAQAAATAILVTFAFALLTLGKELLIPMVLAIFIWYLINILADSIANIQVKSFRLPRFLCFSLALFVIFGSLVVLTNVISSSVNEVIAAAPEYQRNVDSQIDRVSTLLHLEETPQLNELIRKIDFSKILQDLGMSLAGFIGSAGLILIYTLFIFLEQKGFLPKIDNMTTDEKKREMIRRILSRIYADTKTYIGIKTFTSLLTALVSYLIMKSVGLELSMFWALLIFLFNYIPTIGSILATIFPSIMALVQFPETLGPFAVVVIGVVATQMIVGNIIEPRLMGNTLNLSPLVILLSLALWGSIWGIPGAILCVPITVVMVIIFSNFKSTRPVAILLSKDGEIRREA
jgi:predicted PurR-regulated permease PerM